MSLLDTVGRLMRTNDVVISPYEVRKRYRNFAIPMLWARLERKPYLSAQQRYEREKTLLKKFSQAGLNVPEIKGEDDENVTLTLRTLQITDFVQIFRNPAIPTDDKLQYYQEGLEQLLGVHNLGETHGDPYLKNFFRLDKVYDGMNGDVLFLDVEYYRESPVTDLLIYVANATSMLNKHNPDEAPATFSILEKVYEKGLSFPFDRRDLFFFKARFGMKDKFFEYFSSKRTISLPHS